jgi:hypothetical protein
MAQWKKVITSGSNAELANLTATGADIKLTGLVTGSTEHVLLVDDTTGAVKKIAMGSVTGADTTYSISTETTGSDATITLTASGGGTDAITLVAGNNITISEDGEAITIASTNDYAHPTQSAINVDQTALQTIDTVTVNTLGHVTGITSQSIQTASTSAVGVVQLSDSTSTTDSTVAATSTAVSSSMAAAAAAQATATAAAATAGAISSLSSEEIAQLANIGESTTISATQWGYLGATNQGLTSTSNVTFGTITATGNVSTSANVTGATASFDHLTVSGSATMDGSLVFNGVSFTETSILTSTGSNTFGTDGGGNTQTFYGASGFNDGDVTISGSLILTNNDLAVQYGGTGAGTFTDGGILLGSGTGAITAMAVLAAGQMIVGDGSTDPVAESGGTLRTSIGVGTGDSPQFTGIELGNASDTTIARVAAGGDITIEGNIIYRAGGNDVPVADGGTGVSTLSSGQVLIGNGTGSITSTAIGIADNNIVEIDDGNAASGMYAKFTANGIEGKSVSEVRDDLGLGSIYASDIATTSSQISNNTASNAAIPTSGMVYDYIAGQGFGQGSGDISSVNITAGAGFSGSSVNTSTGDHNQTLTVGQGNGITVNATDVAVTAAQTTITSVLNDGLTIGRSTGNDYIDFGAGGEIKLKTNNTVRLSIQDATTTISNALVVTGDLTVNGTTTTVNSTIVEIDDAFISLGAAAGVANIDSGIIFGARSSGGTTVAGDSLFWDGDYNSNDGRLGIDHDVAVGASSATAQYYLAGVTIGDESAATAAKAVHPGNLRIDAGEIYIYI